MWNGGAVVLALLTILGLTTHRALAQPGADDPVVVQFDTEPVPTYGTMGVTSPEGRRLLQDGRALIIGFQLGEAEAVFHELDRVEPGNPAGIYHRATLALWRAMMNEREPYYGRFFAVNDTLQTVAESLPDGPWRTHLEAEAASHRAIIYAKQERYTKAASNMRAAFVRYEDNVRDYPDFWESYRGMGLSHIAVGSVPRSYRWILRLLGFGGTVQQGMAELEQALQHSTYSREEAALYLAVVDALLNERKGGAVRHVEALYEAYPESPMPAYLYAFLLLDARDAEGAEARLREALARQESEAVDDIPYVDFYLGEALFRQNRFEEAIPYFERYARSYRGNALLAQAHLYAGLAHEMSGDRDRAVSAYERIHADRDYDSDKSAQRRAGQLIEQPMTAEQRTLLLGQNQYDAGHYREAIATLQPVLTNSALDEVERAEAAYRSGRAYQALEVWEEALRHYAIAVERPGDPLAKWGPWSQLYIGEVHEAQGHEDEARRAYRAALENEDEFDYHKALEQRARTALGRL